MTTKKKLGKSADQVAMEDALEVVLERAEWVDDKLRKYMDDEYDINQVVDEWIDDHMENALHNWLDDKYDSEGPDGSSFEKIVKDACAKSVKEHITDQIMLGLLDEVRKNMGKMLGRAMHDCMNDVNKGESK